MKERKLLSILIPTYNRVNYLLKNLNVILSQIDNEIIDLIEIKISDNGSTDNTIEQLELLKKKSNIIEYSVNETNLGADRNFLKLVREATGKFIWIFGDDEYFYEGGLRKIIDYLKKNKDIGIFSIKNSKKKRKIIYYEDKKEFMKKINYKISFITAHIFNREGLDNSINYESFCDTSLVQELFYFNTVNKFDKNAIIQDRIFLTDRADNIGGYKLFQVFCTNQNEILEYFEKKGFDKSIKENINRMMCIEFFPQYILMNKLSKGNTKWIKESVEETLEIIMKNYIEYKFFCKPLFYFNFRVAKIYYRFTKKIKKIYKLFFGY